MLMSNKVNLSTNRLSALEGTNIRKKSTKTWTFFSSSISNAQYFTNTPPDLPWSPPRCYFQWNFLNQF